MPTESHDLDISVARPEQKVEILKYAAEARRFEIERFWQRSIFFWGFVAAAFVAYVAASDPKQPDKLLPLIIGCFGFICSFAWTLQNRGSKYWQEAWENKIKLVERYVLGANLFDNREPLQKKGWWGAAPYSVSKLAIALSDFTVGIWCLLVLKAFLWPVVLTCASLPVLVVACTAIYTVSMLLAGRSKS